MSIDIQHTNSIDSLCVDICLYILDLLPPKDVLSMSCVSKRYHDITKARISHVYVPGYVDPLTCVSGVVSRDVLHTTRTSETITCKQGYLDTMYILNDQGELYWVLTTSNKHNMSECTYQFLQCYLEFEVSYARGETITYGYSSISNKLLIAHKHRNDAQDTVIDIYSPRLGILFTMHVGDTDLAIENVYTEIPPIILSAVCAEYNVNMPIEVVDNIASVLENWL